MGTSLTGLTPAATYDGLLKTTDNEPIGATEKVVTDGLGNNSALKVGTESASVQGGFQVTGTLKDSSGDVGTSGQVLSSTATGTDWVDVSSGGGVSGSNSVYVVPEGTAEENGVLLLNGLTDAISKIGNTPIPGADIPMNMYDGGYLGGNYTGFAVSAVQFSVVPQYQATFLPDGFTPTQVLITINWVGDFGPDTFNFDITDLDGNPVMIGGGPTPDFPTPSTTLIVPSTLIVAPGDYSIASDFILNNLVNVTSLTGQADVNISTSNVKIQSGANNSSHPISIVGLNLTTSLWIESNLSSLTFKNCKALGTNSFSIEPSGTGSISGTFEDCTGDFRSFGSGIGVTAAGLFIRCKSTGTQAFGGRGSTSGYFEYCGGAAYSSGVLSVSSSFFGNEGVTINGYFYYCMAGNGSFASDNTGATGAEFYYCKAGNLSFGYRNTNNSGKYYNCSATNSGTQCFGANARNGDTAANARYYNCTANTIAQSSTLSSRFYNCHAATHWSGYIATNGGLAYNCSFGSAGGQGGVTGTGKYRNCLDSSFAIINAG